MNETQSKITVRLEKSLYRKLRAQLAGKGETVQGLFEAAVAAYMSKAPKEGQ